VSDSFDLQRFVDAQASIYRQVVEELSRGRKQTHWMWFIFPQIAGLGFSAMAQHFAIGSHAEAVAYLEHDLLGPRLVECTRLVMAASEKPVTDILGSPDDMKLRSCMTLFDAVSKQEIFAEAIAAFYPDGKDRATLEVLETSRRLAEHGISVARDTGILSGGIAGRRAARWAPSPRPATTGSVNTFMNCVIALNVVCCDPVALSPEAWLRPDGDSVPNTSGMPPAALKKFVSVLATACWLALRPLGVVQPSLTFR
jgi:uncharacterized protein (DUF1810 family)